MTGIDASPSLVWGVILLIAAGTLALRVSFIVLFGRLDDVPDWLERLLELVPPAAIAALVLPSLVYLDGSVAVSPGNDRLLAGLVAVVVAWRTESLLATVAVGMALFLGLQYLV
ncbi:MAG: AzlD domain-containing protein [Haloferacaceae archaeon]